jgi:predicted DNA-binding ribbon-helix-helix protein
MLADTMLITAQAMQDDRIRKVSAAMLIAEMRAEQNIRAAIRVRCGALLVRLGARLMATQEAPVTRWRVVNVSR